MKAWWPRIGLVLGIAALSLASANATGATTTKPVPKIDGGVQPGWSVTPSPDEGGDVFVNFLSGVSCANPTSCVAVGFTINGTPPQIGNTLTERWDGSSWSIVTSPNPGSAQDVLNAVSCTAPDFCMAVGDQEAFGPSMSSEPPMTLVESWDGSIWSVVPSPNVGDSDVLDGVSCTTASSCVAVGEVGSGSTLVESWDGFSWSVVSSPNGNGPGNNLLSVSCLSATFCMAIGGSGTGPLAESWDGSAWTIVPMTDQGNSNFPPQSVSCTSASSCVAVGSYGGDKSPQHPLIESWDGTAWSIVASPDPPVEPGYLEGVSCTGPDSCVAVGAYSTTEYPRSLIESWDGTTWSLVTDPEQAIDNALNGVTCLSATSCVGVGYIRNSDAGDDTFVVTESLAEGVSLMPTSTLPATTGSVTYGVTVEGAGPVPTGSVTVADNKGGSCEIASLASGTGSCAIDESAGLAPYTVRADYSGDAVYAVAEAAIIVSGGVSSGGTASSLSEGIAATASGGTDGTDTVTSTSYGGDPVGSLTDGSAYFDTAVSPGNTFSQVVIQDCDDIDTSSALSWWDPTAAAGSGAWRPVVGNPGPSYSTGPPACLSVTLDSTSLPSLSELSGTVFGMTGTLEILTSSLPTGELHSHYAVSLAAAGGNAPYKWSIISGGLPQGLKLNKSRGSISGKPKARGTFSVVVQLIDKKTKTKPHTQNRVTKTLSILIY